MLHGCGHCACCCMPHIQADWSFPCAGGVATGLAFGLACTFWLRFMYRHLLAEVWQA